LKRHLVRLKHVHILHVGVRIVVADVIINVSRAAVVKANCVRHDLLAPPREVRRQLLCLLKAFDEEVAGLGGLLFFAHVLGGSARCGLHEFAERQELALQRRLRLRREVRGVEGHDCVDLALARQLVRRLALAVAAGELLQGGKVALGDRLRREVGLLFRVHVGGDVAVRRRRRLAEPIQRSQGVDQRTIDARLRERVLQHQANRFLAARPQHRQLGLEGARGARVR